MAAPVLVAGMSNDITRDDDLSALTELGKVTSQPSRKLEVFPNRNPGRDYVIELVSEEFTSLCPATGQPDYATITIRYVPDAKIVESKSLKMYFWSFRNEGVFQEHLTNAILDDLVAVLEPKWCEVVGRFSPRGGIAINVRGEHQASNRPDNILSF